MGTAKQTRAIPTFEEQMGGTYQKIHKILGADNRNKDVREELNEILNEKPEN